MTHTRDPEFVAAIIANRIVGTTGTVEHYLDTLEDIDPSLYDTLEIEVELRVVHGIAMCPKCGWWWDVAELNDDFICVDCVLYRDEDSG